MFRRSLARCSRKTFSDVKMGPADPILGLTVSYNEDTHPDKVNLGVGAYRDDSGKPYVLACVREAEKRICGNMDHEYAGITGVPKFVKVAQELLFGSSDSARAAMSKTCTSQTISGTGALRVAAEFLNRFYPGEKAVYMPAPTWGNHDPVFNNSGITVKPYNYYDKETCGLDLTSMLADLNAMPDGSIVLLHACAHNPTGVDPTVEQWQAIEAVMAEKGHYPFFDSAYQGFASGKPETDAYAIRLFLEKGHEMMVTQSFAKNLGLYGERIGAMHIVCADNEEKARVESQLKILIRPMYSNPPVFGARIVATIFEDEQLKADWAKEVKVMADRIIGMRQTLTAELKALGSTKNWEHIEKQIGMFCFTGLTKDQVARMKSEFHIYLTGNGRISMAGVTSGNVKHIANAMHEVTK